jgi:hypothetical protein
MSEQVIPERPNFRTCKHGNAACLCAECEPVIPNPGPCLCPPQCGEFCTGRCVSAPRFCPDRCDYWEYRANAAESKVAELEATIERLTKIGHASLREYGRHATECHWWATCRDGDCTCGFLNCIAALSKQVHP